MLVLCHRGYHINAPENTIEAFKAAIERGVDGIETDIRLSADGIPILFHDRFVIDGREVSSLSHAELSKAVGYSVPALDSALQLSFKKGKDLLWDLEIKTAQALYPTLAIVSQYKDSRKIMITSFLHPLIEEAGRVIDVDLGVLFAHRPMETRPILDWIPNLHNLKTIIWDYEMVDNTILTKTKADGLQNFIYGAVTELDHNNLKDWNVDGVITDKPEYLLDERR